MITELNHQALLWAFNMTDVPLNDLLREIGDPNPRAMDSSVTVLHGTFATLSLGQFDIGWQADALVDAWSAPQPVTLLRRLAQASDEAAAKIRNSFQALRLAAPKIEQAQERTSAAIEVANGAADWAYRTYLTDDSDESIRRTAAINQLLPVVKREHGVVISAINALDGIFDGDPASVLDHLPVPAALAGAAPPPSSAAVVDQQNRQKMAADLKSADPDIASFAREVSDAMASAPKGTPVQLLIYDPTAFDGQGRASVSIGDLATSDHVGVLTPGVLNSPRNMSGVVGLAAGLKAAAEKIAPEETTAMVLWFGYNIPLSKAPGENVVWDLVSALTDGVAVAGGKLLAQDLEWIHGMAPNWATVTAIGHSMGAVTTSQALRTASSVDAAVLLASPGSGDGVRSTKDYTISGDRVFVASFDDDPITRWYTDVVAGAFGNPFLIARGLPGIAAAAALGKFQPFGRDPASAGFMGQRIDTEGTLPPLKFEIPGALVPKGSIIDRHPLPNYVGGGMTREVAKVITGRTTDVRRKGGR